jgi:hypothetical protein
MALSPITKMLAALRGLGLPAVPVARIGETAPKLPGELPAVRVVASELAFAPLGIGGSRAVRLDADANWVEDRARRITGVLDVEVWGADEDAVNILAVAVAEGLAGIETDLLAAGFLRLRQSRWRPAEEAPLRGVQDGKALRQALAYDIVFEDVETAPADEGVIQRIDIRVKPPVEEDFDVRKGRDVP